MDENGRVAIVTGAGDGIGRAVARRLSRDGLHVVVADLDPAAAEAVAGDLAATGGGATAVGCDVADEEGVVGLVTGTLSRFGSVDVLVNNAWGGGTLSRVEQKTTAQLSRGIAVGYLGPFWAMRAAFPSMRANGWGRVVNMCSLNGVNAHMGTLEYNAAKEALRTLTRTAAREWAPYGITVNALCPAAKTAAFRRAMAAHPELGAAADAANPMGRLGDPDEDIAPVVSFLAGDDARYLTGNTLFVDGGGHINGAAWTPELPETPSTDR